MLASYDPNLPDGQQLVDAFVGNRELLRAWEVAHSKGLREGLRADVPTLQMIDRYQNSSFSSRLAEWTDEEFATHFEFLYGDAAARQRFNQYLDDDQIFLPKSPAEKVEILRLLGVDQLVIFERLGLFRRLIDDAPAPSNPDEALDLINRMLDDVEDAYSGVPKNPDAINQPNIQDGRMYGILDDKYVKNFPDGGRRAYTRKNTIMIDSDGSFSIYIRDKSNPPNQIGNLFLSKQGQ